MKMTPVESSNVKAIGRDGDDMLLLFNKGVTYRYLNVPVEVTEKMLAAPSVGQFFHAEIKTKYQYLVEPT